MAKRVKASTYIWDAQINGRDVENVYFSGFDPTSLAYEMAEIARANGFDGKIEEFIVSNTVDWGIFQETIYQKKLYKKNAGKISRKLDKGKTKDFSVTRICCFCGRKFFPHKGATQSHCSYKCGFEDRKKRKQLALKSLEKPCQRCGIVFIPNEHDQKFCSVSCAAARNSKKISFQGTEYASMNDFARAFGLNIKTTFYRFKSGWNLDDIVTDAKRR